MITVVSRWEQEQMPVATEWRMYRQLRGAFKIDRFIFTPVMPDMGNVYTQQADSMKQALLMAGDGARVFLEPTGHKTMRDLPPREGDVVFILGNTAINNIEHAQIDETYRIYSPGKTDIYPTGALPIALAYWVGQ